MKAVNTIALIACASKKRNRRAKAEDLYDSELFRKSLAYAKQMQPAAIFILSAKHGLVQLDDLITPYDVTLNKMSRAQAKAWSDRVLDQLRSRTNVEKDHFVVLAGDRYRRDLVPELRSVEVPMEGLGIGKQLQFLKRQLT
jgi:Family of unknown function (DUF6884)